MEVVTWTECKPLISSGGRRTAEANKKLIKASKGSAATTRRYRSTRRLAKVSLVYRRI